MTLASPRCLRQHLTQPTVAAAMTLLLTHPPSTFAGPGAHGPNGEHLDARTPTHATSVLPRLEARTEAFELVAELRNAEMAIVVDRYETNEPVLGAKLEVESGAVRAVAAFRPERGDYTVTDAALLKALSAPGEHGLVFTLVAGAESDLLDGTLVADAGRAATAAARTEHGDGRANEDRAHGHGLERATWIGSGIAALGLLGIAAWWRQRRNTGGQPKGAP